MKNNKKVEFMEEIIGIETRKMWLMSLTTHPNPTIPFDLLTIEILTRLPAKSLIRFKTVSKQFLSTISSRKFINLHAQRSNTNNLNHGVVIETRWSPIFKEGSVVLCHDNKLRVTFDHYKFPISISDESFTILGSCNGLVCLWNCCNGTICIWNPITKEYRYVPKPSLIATSYVYDINPGLWGLTYLPSIDDHKVVNLNLCWSRDKIRFQVSVFTFKTNNWNRYMVDPFSLGVVENLRFNTQYVLGIVLSNNVSHWLMYKWKAATGGTPFILAFDMVTETFNEVPLTQDITNSKSNTFFNFNLSRVKDNLCVEAEYRSMRSQVLYRIVWELKQYGKWGSWEKIVVLCVQQDCVETKDIHDLDNFATNINESYQFLMYMLQSGGWVIYQRNDGRHKCIQLDKLHCGRLVCSHVNTLVSPFVGLETN